MEGPHYGGYMDTVPPPFLYINWSSTPNVLPVYVTAVGGSGKWELTTNRSEKSPSDQNQAGQIDGGYTKPPYPHTHPPIPTNRLPHPLCRLPVATWRPLIVVIKKSCLPHSFCTALSYVIFLSLSPFYTSL